MSWLGPWREEKINKCKLDSQWNDIKLGFYFPLVLLVFERIILDLDFRFFLFCFLGTSKLG